MSELKIFKFGGASVRDANGVRNIASILNLYAAHPLVVIISAMGKTTNGLEKVVENYFSKSGLAVECLNEIKKYHIQVLDELFSEKNHTVFTEVSNVFEKLQLVLKSPSCGNYDYEYDRIVSYGEIISTLIVSRYLHSTGIRNCLFDVRQLLKTDDTYREAKVNWQKTGKLIPETINAFFAGSVLQKEGPGIAITQGFIGSTSDNKTTTLGREGSDYTAAVFAYCLNATEVTIWKDVGGVLNADPKTFAEAVMLRNISYTEAIELSYFGATVIHPKTIQPLQNRKITLRVKSFIHPDDEGTLINNNHDGDSLVPSYIIKQNQVLISISPKDFSFIVEENLSQIFSSIARYRAKVNVMQNSAISFSVCADNDSQRIPSLIKELRKNFKILYNKNLELITIRHYNQSTVDRLCKGKKIFLEQKSRNTIQVVVK